MKRTMIAMLFTIIFSFSVFAQTPASAAPQYYRVQTLKMNPGMSADWQKFYQSEILPGLKKAGVKQSSVWSVAQGDVRQYFIITPFDSLAQLDEPGYLAKALGQEAARALNLKQSHFVAEWQSNITVGRPDLSITPTTDGPTKLAVVADNPIVPGRTAEYEKWLKENLIPLVKKTNAKGAPVTKMFMGGNPNTYTAMVFFDSYDDLGKFQSAFTNAVTELKLSPVTPAGIVASTQWTVVRYVPELSIIPTPPKEAK